MDCKLLGIRFPGFENCWSRISAAKIRSGYKITAAIRLCESCGNREEKIAATPCCTFDPDASSVSLNDPFGDGKPEAGALTPDSGCFPKSVKNVRQVFGPDATPCVRDSEDDLVTPQCRTHCDMTASLREFDCVANKVLEYLKEPVPITPDLGNIRVHLDSKFEGRGRCKRFLHIYRFAY